MTDVTFNAIIGDGYSLKKLFFILGSIRDEIFITISPEKMKIEVLDYNMLHVVEINQLECFIYDEIYLGSSCNFSVLFSDIKQSDFWLIRNGEAVQLSLSKNSNDMKFEIFRDPKK